MPLVQVDPSQIKFDAPRLGSSAPAGFVPVDPSKIQFDKPEMPGAFEGAVSDIWRNTKEAAKNTLNETGKAIDEPVLNSNAPWYLAPADMVVRGLAKTGNGIAGAFGVMASPVVGALSASVENSGVIPAAAKSIKENLVPDDPRFSADISPEAQHNIAMQAGGDLANAVYTGAGGIQAQRMRDIAAGNPVSEPYNPITETIVPAVKKFEAASQNLPGLAGSSNSGVSVNSALAGIPEGVSLRAKGFMADKPDELAGAVSDAYDSGSNYIQKASQAGVRLTPQKQMQIVADVKQAVGKLNSRHGDTMAELADMEQAAQQGKLTLDELDKFRQNFGDVVSDNTKSKVDGGGLNSDGYKALQAKNAIRDSYGNITDVDLTNGNVSSLEDLNHGLADWAKASRMEKVAEIIRKSEGDSVALQRNFKKFADSLSKSSQGYSPEEITAIQNIAQRGVGEHLERALGTFGFDTGRLKNIALPTLVKGGALAIPGGTPLVAAGTVARQTGKLAARGKAQNAFDVISGRDTAPPANPRSSAIPAASSKPVALLPAPPVTNYVNSYGQIVPLSPAGRDIIGQSPPAPVEPTLKEIMAMTPQEAREALNNYLRRKNQRR